MRITLFHITCLLDSLQDDTSGQDSNGDTTKSPDKKLENYLNGEDSTDTIQNDDTERQQSMEDKQEATKNSSTGGASCARTKEFVKKGNDRQFLHKDLCNSFTPSLAYYSYVLFCRVLGDHFVASILYNEDLIWQLCSTYDEGLTLTNNCETLEKATLQEANDKKVNSVQKADEKGRYFLLISIGLGAALKTPFTLCYQAVLAARRGRFLKPSYFSMFLEHSNFPTFSLLGKLRTDRQILFCILAFSSFVNMLILHFASLHDVLFLQCSLQKYTFQVASFRIEGTVVIAHHIAFVIRGLT